MTQNADDGIRMRKYISQIPKPEATPIPIPPVLGPSGEKPKKETPKNDDYNEYEYSDDKEADDREW